MDNENSRPNISALKIDRSKKYDDRPKSKALRWISFAIVLALIVIGYFMLKGNLARGTSVQVAQATIVSGSEASADLIATGYVVARRMAEVSSKATGRLAFIGYQEGDTVTDGQVIARLDNADFVALVEQAKASLQQAKVDTLNTGRHYRRARDLFKSGAVTDVDLENAETAYKSALANLQAASAALKVAQVDLDNTYIRAPFSGTILTKNAEVGEMVAPFASSASAKGSVVTLADMNSLEVEADVSESNIYKVQPNQRCEIVLDAYPGVRYSGYVKRIVPTADRARATVLTRVAFDKIDSRVLPEMSARVSFFVDDGATGQSDDSMLTIPSDAITSREGRKIVFRVEGEQAVAVPVSTGLEVGSRIQILEGLKRGDSVVLSPPGKLQSGQKIKIST